MEGSQQIKDVDIVDVSDLKCKIHILLEEILISFPINLSLVFLLFPVCKVLHQLLGDRLHVEAAGTDGHPWKVEAGHWHGGVLQRRGDQVLLPVVVGGQRPIGTYGKSNSSDKGPK